MFSPSSSGTAVSLNRLVVDVGNTRIKWGLCDPTGVVASASLPPDDAASWHDQLAAWQILGKIDWAVSGVHPQRCEKLVGWITQRGDMVRLLASCDDLPLHIAVEQPNKVGIDRLLNAVALNLKRQPHHPAIVVDAGTAVTVDYVDVQGTFRGGAIFPGLQLMAKSLNDYTALLPLIEVDASIAIPGTSTTAAMKAGIFCAVTGGIGELIRELKSTESNTNVVEVYLTGGDALCLSGSMPAETTLWPWMTLEGLRLATWREKPL